MHLCRLLIKEKRLSIWKSYYSPHFVTAANQKNTIFSTSQFWIQSIPMLVLSTWTPPAIKRKHTNLSDSQVTIIPHVPKECFCIQTAKHPCSGRQTSSMSIAGALVLRAPAASTDNSRSAASIYPTFTQHTGLTTSTVKSTSVYRKVSLRIMRNG